MNTDRIATLVSLMATHLNEIAQELKGTPGPATMSAEPAPTSAPASTPEAQTQPAPEMEIDLDKFRQLTRDLVAREPTKAPGLIRPLIASMGVEGGIVDVPPGRRMEFLKSLSQAIKDATVGG